MILARQQNSTSPPPADRREKVAVLFRRIGPYHHARLNGAGRLFDVFGLEACAMDDTYAWDKVNGAAGFTRVTLTEHWKSNPAWKFHLQLKTRHALDSIRPAVVALPGWSSADALGALLWCAATQTPAVLMSESTEWDELRKAWKEKLKRRVAGCCSAALVGGRAHADYLAKLGMPADRIFTGYDAVDNEHFSRGAAEVRERAGKARLELGLPQRFFLASARFIDKKNLPGLLEAYARYSRMAGSDAWHLVLLGDGPLKLRITTLISELKLQDRVHLPGFRQYAQLPAYYALASAFVHASTSEPWGLVVNEALASGLPVLVSRRCGCARELVREGINGHTFDPQEPEQLAVLMHALHSADLSAMGRAGLELVSEWGPARFASGLSEAVEAAKRNGPPRFNALDQSLIQLLLLR
jgi:1,2-diacylglycerol 3-alpha-glucosyltransferase